jgi:hypothetical protein
MVAYLLGHGPPGLKRGEGLVAVLRRKARAGEAGHVGAVGRVVVVVEVAHGLQSPPVVSGWVGDCRKGEGMGAGRGELRTRS